MAVDAGFTSLYEKLKLEDPWLPPRTWESIPSQSGNGPSSSADNCSRRQSLFDVSTVSEASLVRLAMNALLGVQSAIVSIEKLAAAFCSDPADRSFHRNSSLWNRSSSTHALGRILKSIGYSGCLVLFLRRFVEYFGNLTVNINSTMTRPKTTGQADDQTNYVVNIENEEHPLPSLVNQAFAVALGKILEGYMCSLDTLSTSIGLRCSFERAYFQLDSPSRVGCLTDVALLHVSLLEVHSHTKELRTQMEAVGNICKMHEVALCFSSVTLEDLLAKTAKELHKFPRGGDLLTYLHEQLQVADPAHCRLLKFLFIRSCDPYFTFVRSWIYEAEINDPYKEFVVEYISDSVLHPLSKAGSFPAACIRVQDEVAVPCFLKDFLVPLVRAGQQLQVLLKLFELCNHVAPRSYTYEEFLPNWRGFWTQHPSYASPLTFSKERVEDLVNARSHYYREMHGKLEKLLTKLEVRNEQVATFNTVSSVSSSWASSNPAVSLSSAVQPSNDSLSAPSVAVKVGSALVTHKINFDDTSTVDGSSYAVDKCVSPHCSSSTSSEDLTEDEELIEQLNDASYSEEKYLSALRFSSTTSTGSSLQKSHDKKIYLDRDFHEPDLPCNALSSHCNGKLLTNDPIHGIFGVRDQSILSESQIRDAPLNGAWSSIDHLDDPNVMDAAFPGEAWVSAHGSSDDFRKWKIEISQEVVPFFSQKVATCGALLKRTFCTEENSMGSCPSSILSILQSLDLRDHQNLLSVNPVLTKGTLAPLMCKPGVKESIYGKSLPFFDFTSVEDPFRVCLEKSAFNSKEGAGFGQPFFVNSSASAAGIKTQIRGEQEHGVDGSLIVNLEGSCKDAPLGSKDQHQNLIPTNVSGGSSWESFLGCCNSNSTTGVIDHEGSSSACFEMPLDYVIQKCILQEILLQYVSRLTIKLLEEQFYLHEHLLSLRRYHFMETADWADLFIMSLWHHKELFTGLEKRVSDVQELLEMSIQRSSCLQDFNKDRLFVYVKEAGVLPQSTAIGVNSFDFLGLGYRVDWPISIIVTPAALDIYTDIFNFLIKVKLAAFSLTHIWCFLKGSKHLISPSGNSETPAGEVNHFTILVKMRHQLNHFVSMLQQYLQSQLSHISWSRFLHSLQHKVKDMMDLESVHMEYLADSLDICFLSEETCDTGRIIRNVLQCAMDFQSCLNGNMRNTGVRRDLSFEQGNINYSQVHSIKQNFEKNLKELHLIYRRSSKHGKFGLSNLWGYLDYNEYFFNSDTQHAFMW